MELSERKNKNTPLDLRISIRNVQLVQQMDKQALANAPRSKVEMMSIDKCFFNTIHLTLLLGSCANFYTLFNFNWFIFNLI